MSDTNAYARERSNSTHEAYLKRIGISPIVIPPPTPSQLPQVLHAPHAPQVSQTQHTAHTAHTVHTPYVSQLLQVQQGSTTATSIIESRKTSQSSSSARKQTTNRCQRMPLWMYQNYRRISHVSYPMFYKLYDGCVS